MKKLRNSPKFYSCKEIILYIQVKAVYLFLMGIIRFVNTEDQFSDLYLPYVSELTNISENFLGL